MTTDGHAPPIHPSLPDGVHRGAHGELTFRTEEGADLTFWASHGKVRMSVRTDGRALATSLTASECGHAKACANDVIRFGTYDQRKGRYEKVQNR
jgi:hypothetical protein